MKDVPEMVCGMGVLLFCQLFGEVIAKGLHLPVPGPVLGLALLVIGLAVWNRLRPFSDTQLVDGDLGRVSQGLLANLALLFVPAGVGVVQYMGLVVSHGVALGVALIVSTVLTLVITVYVFLLVQRLAGVTP